MSVLGLEAHVVDQRVLEGAVRRFRDAGIILPTIAELAEPDFSVDGGVHRVGVGAEADVALVGDSRVVGVEDVDDIPAGVILVAADADVLAGNDL